MRMNSTKRVGIVGTGSFLPERVLTNFELEKMVDTSDEWIRTRCGVEERRIADENTATSDLATKAALAALENAGKSPGEIDLILVATVTPDMSFPSTACIVQKNIGADRAAAVDVEAACTGFIYGIAMAESFVKTGLFKNILVIGAETLSKICDYTDRNTCVLFGDGAGAAVVSEIEGDYGILSSYLGADGGGAHLLTLPGGGSRLPVSEKTLAERLHYIKMDGSEVYKFAIRIMGEAADRALEKSGMTREDIDFLIPHQANIRIIESATRRLRISPDKVYINLSRYGNMSSASVAVALDEVNRNNRLKDGETVVLVGFGGGLTWGAVVLKWKNIGR